MSAQSAEELSKAIVKKVTEYWINHKGACLLSLLGKMLITDGFNLQAILGGRKLRAYISAELGSELRVLHPSGNPLKVGVVPIGADLSTGVDALFVSPESSGERSVRVPNFVPAFWAAFTKPISAGQIRTLSLVPKIQFQDVSKSAVIEGGKMTVGEELITPRESLSPVEHKGKVYSNIQSWLAINNIGENDVLAGASNFGSESEVGRVESSSLLCQVLNALTEEEKRRISLPLDIVAKLAKV